MFSVLFALSALGQTTTWRGLKFGSSVEQVKAALNKGGGVITKQKPATSTSPFYTLETTAQVESVKGYAILRFSGNKLDQVALNFSAAPRLDCLVDTDPRSDHS